MRTFLRKLDDLLFLFRADLRLRYAVRRADRAHAATNERYYVLPDHRDRLIILCRRSMCRMRRYGVMDPGVRVRDLLRECFYFTPDGTGGTISPAVSGAKRKMYIDYIMRDRRPGG